MDPLGVVMSIISASSLAAAIFAPVRDDGLRRAPIFDTPLIRSFALALRPIRAGASPSPHLSSARVTWPSALSIAPGEISELERHAVLHLLALEADGSNDVALCRAYAEENERGRLLALAALSRSTSDACRAVVRNALRHGSDRERALAIDLLTDAGQSDLLVVALDDRLDAVAARAALGFVGTRTRAEFERHLAPYVAAPRLRAILGLLDGAFLS